MGTCFIVGAGEFTPRDFMPLPQDCVIAADGGLRPLLAMGITPDLLMGDLDSLGEFDLPASLPLVQFSAMISPNSQKHSRNRRCRDPYMGFWTAILRKIVLFFSMNP